MITKGFSTDDQSPPIAVVLARWSEIGWIRPLDWAFGAFLQQEAPDASKWLILAATLASHQLGRGQVYLDLAATLEAPKKALSLPPERAYLAEDDGVNPPQLPDTVLDGLTLDAWREALRHPRLVDENNGLLVLADNRLYLRRYWQYEKVVKLAIQNQLDFPQDLSAAAASIRSILDDFFPSVHDISPDWQKIACALAARSRFSVITGGPGTGKTTTVVKLLALLQKVHLLTENNPLEIRLAAPTGKAAARLNQSITNAIHSNKFLAGMVFQQVTTLHRLLGAQTDSRSFRYHKRNLLPIDILVIDEVSMVNLETMAATLEALPPKARLILLGDKDQLASVEPGSVLGGLCHHAEEGNYTQETIDWIEKTTGFCISSKVFVNSKGDSLSQAITVLRYSHRFSSDSGIGQLAAAVNNSDTIQTLNLFNEGKKDLNRLFLQEGEDAAFNSLIIEGGRTLSTGEAIPSDPVGYRYYLQVLRATKPAQSGLWDSEARDNWAKKVLKAHDQFQVLCVLREGPWGVEGLNLRIENLLVRQGLISRQGEWYEGRPVLVTLNDYTLGLMNGDIGITLAIKDDKGRTTLRVAFIANDDPQRVLWIVPSRLRKVETVFALTVHKSQGSEFTHTALILPDRPNPVLTRELLYTGITRASRWFTLGVAGDNDVLRKAIASRVLR